MYCRSDVDVQPAVNNIHITCFRYIARDITGAILRRQFKSVSIFTDKNYCKLDVESLRLLAFSKFQIRSVAVKVEPPLNGNGVLHIDEVALRLARLVLRWVNVCEYTVLMLITH